MPCRSAFVYSLKEKIYNTNFLLLLLSLEKKAVGFFTVASLFLPRIRSLLRSLAITALAADTSPFMHRVITAPPADYVSLLSRMFSHCRCSFSHFTLYSIRTAFIMPCWPGLEVMRALPFSVSIIVPFVMMFRLT